MPDPIHYIERTRRWYAALGYETAYKWADHCSEPVPFTPLRKPLSQTRVAIITTAALFDPDKGDQGPGAAYNGGAKFFSIYRHPATESADTRISHIAYDRDNTAATDQRTWLPLKALHNAYSAGRIGETERYFYGLPTNRSQRVTRDVYAPQLLTMLKGDNVDAVILMPNCPVCHQSVTLVARHLEARTIPTVIMGCAKDIVERAGAPRFVFSDFPLGNSAGKPHDPQSQADKLSLALDLLETAERSETVQSPQVWDLSQRWKEDYSNPDRFTAEELSVRRREFDTQKAAVRN